MKLGKITQLDDHESARHPFHFIPDPEVPDDINRETIMDHLGALIPFMRYWISPVFIPGANQMHPSVLLSEILSLIAAQEPGVTVTTIGLEVELYTKLFITHPTFATGCVVHYEWQPFRFINAGQERSYLALQNTSNILSADVVINTIASLGDQWFTSGKYSIVNLISNQQYALPIASGGYAISQAMNTVLFDFGQIYHERSKKAMMPGEQYAFVCAHMHYMTLKNIRFSSAFKTQVTDNLGLLATV